MPRQRKNHGGTVYVPPGDFPERLNRLLEESGLPRAEIARRLGVHPFTIWRWTEDGVRPHYRHLMDLLALAEQLGLGHIFTDWTLPGEAEFPAAPPDPDP